MTCSPQPLSPLGLRNGTGVKGSDRGLGLGHIPTSPNARTRSRSSSGSSKDMTSPRKSPGTIPHTGPTGAAGIRDGTGMGIGIEVGAGSGLKGGMEGKEGLSMGAVLRRLQLGCKDTKLAVSKVK